MYVRWGLTGTIPKDDYEAIGCICCIGPVVGNLSSKELQDMGVLADLDIRDTAITRWPAWL